MKFEVARLDRRLKDVEEKVNAALVSTTGLVMARFEYLVTECTESKDEWHVPRPTKSREAGHESWLPLPSPSGGARARRGPA